MRPISFEWASALPGRRKSMYGISYSISESNHNRLGLALRQVAGISYSISESYHNKALCRRF